MKKTTIALAVALASIASAAFAAPQTNTWYVGGKAGWSNYQNTDVKTGSNINDKSVKKNDVGFGGFFGYQATPYFAVEAGYDWLGKAKYREQGEGIPDATYKVTGGQLSAKLSYPIMQKLDAYGRLGAFIWNGKSKADGVAYKDSGIAPLAALGAEYAITPEISTRLEYQWVGDIGNKDEVGVRPNNSLLSLGVAYHFGQSATPVAKPAPVMAKKKKEFVLNQAVLFDFNSAQLKPTAHQELDKLYMQLGKVNAHESTVIVIGHTDRLGSDKVNQAMSEKRAHTVMNYLIKKGIPAQDISARGVGKADSVTANKCDTLKGPSLKTCLAPDRRVVVEVHGVAQ